MMKMKLSLANRSIFAATLGLLALSTALQAQPLTQCAISLDGGQAIEAGDGVLEHACHVPQSHMGMLVPPQMVNTAVVVPSPMLFPAPQAALSPAALMPVVTVPTVLPAAPALVTGAPQLPSAVLAPIQPVTTLPTPNTAIMSAPAIIQPSASVSANVLHGDIGMSSVALPTAVTTSAAFTSFDVGTLTTQYLSILQSGQGIMLPDVLFQGSSAQLPEEANQALMAAAQAMKIVGGTFVVNGFASLEGSPAVNDRLSWSRARVAGNKLIELGIDGRSLFVVGHGGTSLFGPLAKDNRRVTIAPYPG